ncbi:hypothetical protein PF005_g13926 [Phytophthora fragariae]|uniref:Uncharacterized protein n=2 Tax=Phytophthora fragariae TaxID=53985 RepID=A0A6A3XKA5_9STRA|nr:hypothetical protein PF005_g13926 [Phytophthora fragariae]
MRRLRRSLRRTAQFFASFQVELRGHYSVNRMRNFDEYRRNTSAFRALFFCFILPFPCLIVLSMVDAAPLAPPSSSPNANYMFWIRDSILIMLLTRAMIEQISINVPGLHMTEMQRLVPSIAATLTDTTYKIVCSSLIGFPLPFQLVFGIPIGLTTIVICFVGFFGPILKRDRVLLGELIMAIVVINCQILLTFVYPIYFYGFQSVGEKGQRYYVVLLPLIKILAKNLISGALGTKYDLLPQIMIFNVDVFNALYVSSSMQTANSTTTTFVIIMLDAAQALISISDISSFMRHIILLRRKIPNNHPLKSACFVDIALQIIKEDDHSVIHLDSRRYSSAVAVLRRKLSSESRSSDPAGDANRVVPASTITTRGVAVMVTSAVYPASPKEGPTDPTRQIISVFSSEERKLFVHKTAQPFDPNLHIAVVRAQASTQSQCSFYQTELIIRSSILLTRLAQCKLRISMLRLISFVLDKGWRLVQANLCVWIFFTVESSVEHSAAASPLQQSVASSFKKWRLEIEKRLALEIQREQREQTGERLNLEILAAQAKREMLLAEKEGYKTKVLLALTRKQLRDQGVSEEEIDRVLPVNSNIAMVTNEAAAVSSTTVDSPDSELH